MEIHREVPKNRLVAQRLRGGAPLVLLPAVVARDLKTQRSGPIAPVAHLPGSLPPLVVRQPTLATRLYNPLAHAPSDRLARYAAF
jgi:hypothetical protein